MKRVLVVFGTSQGHTAKVAGFLGEVLRATGVSADVVRATGRDADPAPDAYDAVFVAASVHVGGYQRPVRRWVRRHAAALAGRPTGFVSVCLGVLQNEPKVRADLDAILERFFRETYWRPDETKIVAGALPYSRYNPLLRWMMRRIARGAGMETDPRRDYEFTDWEDLRTFANRFAERFAPGVAANADLVIAPVPDDGSRAAA